VWLGAGIVLFFASVALAQAQDPREIEARKDCLSGKYQAGTGLLAELFAETGNANFVYNQARCFEQNSKPDEAIQRFREYLRIAGNLSADDKAGVEGHIAECRAMVAEQEQRSSAPMETGKSGAAAPTTPVPSAAVAPPTEASTALTPIPALPEEPRVDRPIYKKWWFWTGVGAVVVAGTVTAFVLSYRPSSGPCSGISLTCVEVR